VLKALKKFKCAFCIYELDGHLSPQEVTCGFVYVRLHGPGNKYQGSYPEQTLIDWSRKIRAWTGSGKDVYIYFDNDEEAFAAVNAKRLMELV
jgi:uncharacterized protein YecE (DUF72 family)